MRHNTLVSQRCPRVVRIMKRTTFNLLSLIRFACVCAVLWAGAPVARAADAPGEIDWDRARQIYQRAQRGETLNEDERAYLMRAREARQRSVASDTARTNGERQARIPEEDIRRARTLLEKQNT